ncbi:MAG: hypothetical protein JOZ18_16490 [Chloroflexi bacterium]|nr:hypothetical protein [Chloroflexota bacterium]
MKEQCWLLPFTHGVDVRAIETVVRTAEVRGAMLVPVALIAVPPGGRSKGARLEHIQQAKDFLEVVQHIAARHRVLVECHEVFTANVRRGITQLIQDLHCDGLVLISGEQRGLLLSTEEMLGLLMTPPTSLILIRLPVQKAQKQTDSLVARFSSWLGISGRRQQDEKCWQEVQRAMQEDYSSSSRRQKQYLG